MSRSDAERDRDAWVEELEDEARFRANLLDALARIAVALEDLAPALARLRTRP